jgi:hypothetical protein
VKGREELGLNPEPVSQGGKRVPARGAADVNETVVVARHYQRFVALIVAQYAAYAFRRSLGELHLAPPFLTPLAVVLPIAFVGILVMLPATTYKLGKAAACDCSHPMGGWLSDTTDKHLPLDRPVWEGTENL